MTVHRPPAEIIPLEATHPGVVPPPAVNVRPVSAPWTLGKTLLIVGGILLAAQLTLPTKMTPGGIIGHIYVVVEKQKDMAEAEINAISDQLAANRKSYADLLAEYQAMTAKCVFAAILDPQYAELCKGAFDLNYQPQLNSRRSEISRLEAQLRNMESTL